MATDPPSDQISSMLRSVGQHLGEIAKALDDLSKAMIDKADGGSKRVGIFKRLRTSKKAGVAVLGTLLTLWVVPLLTRQAQDRSTARDIKASLADDMSSAFGTLESVATLRAYNLDQLYASGEGLKFSKSGALVKPNPQRILERAKLNAEYADFVRDSLSIRARIAADFQQDHGLADAWGAFTVAATDFYFITENTRSTTSIADDTSAVREDVKQFNQRADSLTNPLRRLTLSAKDLSTLDQGQSTRATIAPFYTSYLNVRNEFDATIDDLVKHILSGHPTDLSTRPCDFWSMLFIQEPGTLCHGA